MVWGDPELTSQGHNKSTVTYATIPSERNPYNYLNRSSMTKDKKAALRQAGAADTQSH